MKKILSLALVLVLVLSACGGGKTGDDDKNQGQESGGDSGLVTVRFASWDSAESIDVQQGLVDQFNESQDGIKVVLEAYGGDYDTKISAGMGSGDAPDVMYMWNYPAYYQGLEPLDAYIEKEGPDYKSNFYDALWAYNKIGDSIYGIPVGFTTHCLYYNKDIFDQAGIAYPTKDWTWDDLQEAAKTITDKVDGVKGFVYPIKADPYDFEMFLWSNGAGYIGEDGKMEGAINSPQAIEVFELYQNMQKDGIAVASEKSGSDEIRSGQAAMFIYGSWSINTFMEDGLNFGIVEVPAFANAGHDSVSVVSSSGLSMAKNSKNKEAAWEFIKYWTGEELNKARLDYELPVLNSVVESENLRDNELKSPFYGMLEQSVGYTPSSYLIEDWSLVSENLSLSLERMYNPSVLEDVKTVVDEAAKMQ